MSRPSRRVSFAALAVGIVAATLAVVGLRPARQPAPETGLLPPAEPVSGDTTKPATRGDVFPYNRVVAVTIGIDGYANLLPPRPLKQAEADAKVIGATFREQFGYEVVPILGAEATRARILDAVDRFGRELGERDALIVYFAGHGQVIDLPGSGEAGYLVPADARLDIENRTDAARWREQAIEMSELVALLNRAKAGHVLVIADACCSGFLTSARGALARYDLKNFLYQRSRVVLAATTRRQKAADGRFTPKLVERLRRLDTGDRGERPAAASVYDLMFGLDRVGTGGKPEPVFGGLLQAVSEESKGDMTPQVAHVGEGDGLFVFVPATVERRELEKDLRDLEAAVPVADRGRTLGAVADRRRAQLEQVTKPEDVYAILEAPDYRLAADPERQRERWERRFERFQRNAAGGDAWAMAALCLCYERGVGVGRDPARAYFWAKQANRAGQPGGVGRYLLGRCYELGVGAPLSGPAAKDAARRLYRESMDAGAVLGRYAVARGLLLGSPSKEDVARGRTLLEESIAGGVVAAEVDLAAELLRIRPGVTGDEKRALDLLKRAADRGNADAHLALFRHYLAGPDKAPPRDRKKAESQLRLAVELGSAPAATTLGEAYRDGTRGRLGLEANDAEAFKLFDRAAQVGHTPAMVASAKMLADGKGTGPNHELAAKRLSAAADAGDAEANFTKGFWLLDGHVLKQSDADAFACFKRAADAGHAPACFMTGALLCEGRGVKVRPRPGPKRASDTLFHQEWHVAMHYLARAYELGIEQMGDPRFGAKEHDFAFDNLVGLKAALLENQAEFSACYPGASAVNGTNAERNFWFLFYAKAAPDIAGDWRQTNPASFRWFCERVGIDPKTFAPLERPKK